MRDQKYEVRFSPYRHENYRQVCDFLIALDQPNWHWARWEWMYQHPYCDREKLSSMGLWLEGDTVVGAVIYDLFPGEALCAALEGYEALLPEILEYAYRELRDEKGLGVAVRDGDSAMEQLLANLGYQKTEQAEPVLCCGLDVDLGYQLPSGFAIREIRFPEDNLGYQKVIWKGFGHEGDQAELEKMLANSMLPPNRRQELCLAVVEKNDEFAAHCTCWYDNRTDYAYVEPVCTVPKYRGMGLGGSVVREALARCRALGAKRALVLSDEGFYKKLGFDSHSTYHIFRKK